jgi:SAM-dependent methyltransferase
MFGFAEADHFGPWPDGGGYPLGFLRYAFKHLRVGMTEFDQVLHVCSGSMQTGVRVDIREQTAPSVVADALSLPFADCSFKAVLADPPYAASYAETLYATGASYPRPGPMMAELCRVTRPGGRIGFMHHMVPKTDRLPLSMLAVYGISQGQGYAIRAWSLFERNNGLRSTT